MRMAEVHKVMDNEQWRACSSQELGIDSRNGVGLT